MSEAKAGELVSTVPGLKYVIENPKAKYSKISIDYVHGADASFIWSSRDRKVRHPVEFVRLANKILAKVDWSVSYDEMKKNQDKVLPVINKFKSYIGGGPEYVGPGGPYYVKDDAPIKRVIGKMSEAKEEAEPMDFETFAAMRGGSRQGFGDAGTHRAVSSMSRKQWNRIVKLTSQRDAALAGHRDDLRKEYDDLVKQGVLRPPTRMEKLKVTASGNPDNASVQAARRILDNMGVKYETPQESMDESTPTRFRSTVPGLRYDIKREGRIADFRIVHVRSGVPLWYGPIERYTDAQNMPESGVQVAVNLANRILGKVDWDQAKEELHLRKGEEHHFAVFSFLKELNKEKLDLGEYPGGHRIKAPPAEESLSELVSTVPGLRYDTGKLTQKKFSFNIVHVQSGKLIWNDKGYGVNNRIEFARLANKVLKKMKWDAPEDQLDRTKGIAVLNEFKGNVYIDWTGANRVRLVSGESVTESEGRLQPKLAALRSKMAKAAQKVYDEWEGEDDPDIGSGGICDQISKAIADVIASSLRDVDVTEGGQEGSDHAWTVAYDKDESFGVDIPPRMYERGAGYKWDKVKGVKFQPNHVQIFQVDRDAIEESEAKYGWLKVAPFLAGILTGGQATSAKPYWALTDENGNLKVFRTTTAAAQFMGIQQIIKNKT